MSAQNNVFALPQGFSVYQPFLGAPLQFFPAVGTQELDDFVNTFIPGPAEMAEKRATIAVDFLQYTQLTGENFKFYPVFPVTPFDSPVTASPQQDSNSSFNASPVMSNWDWSQVSAAQTKASSTRQRRSSPKAAISRHSTTDFSHLPGMKIMTRDGVDVTNSASRGSKTKEQRDHAHLMRIIKACDSCRKKKVRCDPSHKKRGASQSQPQSAAKTAKKMKAVAQEVKAIAKPVIVEEQFTTADMASFVADASFAATSLENLDPSSITFTEQWEEFVNFPAEPALDDYDFFNDPEGHLSPQSFSSFTTTSSSLPCTSSLPGEPNAPSGGLSPINAHTDQQSDVSLDRSSAVGLSPTTTSVTVEQSSDLQSDYSPDRSTHAPLNPSPYRDPGLDEYEASFLEQCYYSTSEGSVDSSLATEKSRIDYNEYVGINHNRIDDIIDHIDRRDSVNVDDNAATNRTTSAIGLASSASPVLSTTTTAGVEFSIPEVVRTTATDEPWSSVIATNRATTTEGSLSSIRATHSVIANTSSESSTADVARTNMTDAQWSSVQALGRTTTATGSLSPTDQVLRTTTAGSLSPTDQVLSTIATDESLSSTRATNRAIANAGSLSSTDQVLRTTSIYDGSLSSTTATTTTERRTTTAGLLSSTAQLLRTTTTDDSSSSTVQVLSRSTVLAVAAANYNAVSSLVTLISAALLLSILQGCFQLLSRSQSQESTRTTSQGQAKQQVRSSAHVLSRSTGKSGVLGNRFSSVLKCTGIEKISRVQCSVSA